MLKLLALQSISAGLVLTNDGTLGVEIRDLKPGAAAPHVRVGKAPSFVIILMS